jgi:methionine-rich copper-binding protein CopC
MPRGRILRRRRCNGHAELKRAAAHAVPRIEHLEERLALSAVTIDGSQHLQTISGFGTNLSSEAWNGGAVAPSVDTLLAHGYTLYRVIVEPVQGWEDANPNTGPYSTSRPNSPYYNNLYGTSTKFTNLWNTIRYLNNHGATVWVNLQSDAPAWMTDTGGGTGTIGQSHETDWATMVSTMVNYAVNTAHVRIDALAPMNEPDNPGDPVQGPQVGAAQYVRMLDTLETQLQGYGLGNIALVGPDATQVSNAVSSYDPALLADPLLMPHIMQFGYHTYGGYATDSNVTNSSTYPGRQIVSTEYDGSYFNEDHGQRATPSQLWTQADTSFQLLMALISHGENGAIIWDGVDNYYLYYQQWSAHGLISYDWTAADPTSQADYGTTPRLYANAQMFQFVAPGSVLIGSSSNSGSLAELAFRNPNGRITLVGENTGTSAQSVTGALTGGLSASRFNFYLTNSSLSEQQQGDVTVANGTFSVNVPADTIFTLTTPSAPAVTGVTPIAGLTSGGQTVTIAGSNFTGATGVAFGGAAATSFVVKSDTSIVAVTPPNTAGTADVTVMVGTGTSPVAAADQFQYVDPNGSAPPTITGSASASLNSGQTAATLSISASSQYPAGTLTYTWAPVGTPPAPVVFSQNGNNAASSITATFSQAGNYAFQVTVADPAGNTATSTVSFAVTQVATTLVVNPASATVVPNGTVQFTGVATDQFGSPYTATPVSWSVAGGGTIDATGKFTADGAAGGPYIVTASGGFVATTAMVTISSNVNVAPNGTAYRWSGLTTSTSNANRIAAAALNDNSLTGNVALSGGADDIANAYEAAGVVWGTSQSITKVTFTNGSFNSSSYDGVFDNHFALQLTTDGSTWTNVSGWSLSPAYPYNVAAAAGVSYTFSGGSITALGVRAVGQVHSLSGNDSWFDNATEVQAYAGAVSTPPAVTGVSPNGGGLPGGTTVTLTGTNFIGATAVFFGGIAANSFTVNSSTQITAVAPASAVAGAVDVTVTTPGGTSATSSADRFTYVAAPAAPTALTPTSGSGQISLSWSPSAGATAYRIYRGTASGGETLLASPTGTAIMFVDSAVTSGTTYYYQVTAVNVGGESPRSSEVAALAANVIPAVVTLTPAQNARNVSANPSLSATFNESVVGGSIVFALTDSGGNAVPLSAVAYTDATRTATAIPVSPLNPDSVYTVTVSGATDRNGNTMAAPVSGSFTVVSAGAPAVTSQSPASGSLNVSATTSLSVTFSESVTTGSISFTLKDSGGNSVAVSTVSYDPTSRTATITPASALSGDAVYTAAISGTTDLNGNVMAAAVSFSFTVASSGPPAVTSQLPAFGATNVSAATSLGVMFNEAVAAGSVQLILTDANGKVVPLSAVSYNAATHTATATPTAALGSGVTYTVTVSGATDLNGNVIPSPVSWTFTTAAVVSTWTQTTFADFSAGILGNTAVVNTAGGEVQLNQAFEDFAGTALGGGWTGKTWGSSGGGPAKTTVSGSILSLGGQQIQSSAVPVGTPIEGRVAFAAAAFQHFGLATDLGTVAGQYWAIFSTNNTTNTLYARTNVNGTTKNVSLGALPTGFHDYLIQPISGGFGFYVDGVLKTTITTAIPTGVALKASFSDFSGGASTPLQADWVRYGAYASSGTFVSSLFDAGRVANWGTATWTAAVPVGTGLTVLTRSGNTATPDSSWSDWTGVSSGGQIASPPARYLQYELVLTSTGTALTPMLSALTVSSS